MFDLKIEEIHVIWHAYVHNHVITIYPSKRKKQWALLYMIAQDFNMDQTYTEKEINEILKTYYTDYVRIRRDLIDYQFLTRTKDGSIYKKQVVSL